MGFDLNVFASEFGIDPATLQSKPEVFKKWNGYLTEADGKYAQATAAEKKAAETLEAIKIEQKVINDRIDSFGVTDSQLTQLRANYAALEAQAKALKDSGFKDINIPEPIKVSEPAAFDPNRFQKDVNSTLVQGFNVMNRYQRLYGKALPDDLDALAREASARRIPFTDYVAQKYDFAGEEQRQLTTKTAAREAEIAAAAVNKYKEEHPVTAGNSEMGGSGASRFPALDKRPAAKKTSEIFGGSPAQRIARSVKRSMEGLAAAS